MKHYKPNNSIKKTQSIVSYRNVLTQSEPQKSLTSEALKEAKAGIPPVE